MLFFIIYTYILIFLFNLIIIKDVFLNDFLKIYF